MKRIRTHAELDTALAANTFLLFIRSLLCEASAAIFREYENWSSLRPGTKTGWIDADADPSLAQAAAERTRVPLALPQALFLRSGRASWTASGAAITGASLGSAFGWPLPLRLGED